ncbi:DUF692 domain-containing protein [Thiolinea disciformis]|uniref:MNIO family bufferin maturase n=1 Tax=Thiolinea disciformis TaxID=125614 RepID=UPI000371B450|nr:DUF692 domain-containing protein [Thiolinea disciformis]
MSKARIQACGIGLRAQHIDQILAEKPAIPWLEILTDNHLIAGSVQQEYVIEIAEYYPLTFHGVGMSLGSVDPLNRDYFQKIKALADRINPAWISDHLCWSSVQGLVTHDLLPLPYNEETLQHLANRILQAQDLLERPLMIENVSSYLQYQHSELNEWEFLSALTDLADCKLLLDVNNIYVNAYNHDFDAFEYLQAIPVARVQEIHLAGYEDRGTHLLDTHGYPVSDQVWQLYEAALQRFGAVPTLIEWDNHVPPLERLLAEAAHAKQVQDHVLS